MYQIGAASGFETCFAPNQISRRKFKPHFIYDVLFRYRDERQHSTKYCSVHAACTTTQYEIGTPSPSSNRVCKALTVCRVGEYEAKRPTPTKDRQCKPSTTETTVTTTTKLIDCAYTFSPCTAACEAGVDRPISVTREPSGVGGYPCPTQSEVPDCQPGDDLCPSTTTDTTDTTDQQVQKGQNDSGAGAGVTTATTPEATLEDDDAYISAKTAADTCMTSARVAYADASADLATCIGKAKNSAECSSQQGKAGRMLPSQVCKSQQSEVRKAETEFYARSTPQGSNGRSTVAGAAVQGVVTIPALAGNGATTTASGESSASSGSMAVVIGVVVVRHRMHTCDLLLLSLMQHARRSYYGTQNAWDLM